MYILRNISPKLILSFAWKPVLFFLIYGAIVIQLSHMLEHNDISIAIPFLPLSTIGIAVSFYVGFKNNQSYDRFWEARKIWGGIVNYSRTWGNQVLSYVSDRLTNDYTEEEIKKIQKRLIYRHIAWFNALRLQLRKPSSFSIDHEARKSKLYKGNPNGEDWSRDVASFILQEGECSILQTRSNAATQIIRDQGRELADLMKKGLIEDFRHMELMHSLEEFYNFQGKCERINNTPLPRQYSYFSHLFIWIFILLLPFGLIGLFADMGHHFIWLALPFYIIIAWVFYTMEAVGDTSEDPFENFINDVPMTALCRTIEIDLREMLGETDIPPKIKPENGILM